MGRCLLERGRPALFAWWNRVRRRRRLGNFADQLCSSPRNVGAADDGRGVLRRFRPRAALVIRGARGALGRDFPTLAKPLSEPSLVVGACRTYGRVLVALCRTERRLPSAR